MLSGQYITPGTGVNWTLQEFVDNSGGVIVFDGSEYLITGSVTISTGDVITIGEAAFFRSAAGVLITVNGDLKIISSNELVTFSSIDEQSFFTGFKFQNSSGSVIHQTAFIRAGGIKLLSSDVEFSGCSFHHFNQENCTGTIDVSQSAPVIFECEFIENTGPALLSPANGSSSPQIYDCFMQGNVTANANMPQINLGTSGADSVRIIGNQIIGNPALVQVGGIAVTTLAGGSLKCRIEGNTIRDNRYGMTQYGNNIGSVIRNNEIENNNTQGLPNLGGSGINFFGNQTNVSFVSENIITGNLWGITIQNSAQPNFGEIENMEMSPGQNQIFGNGNSGEVYELYNNTSYDIWAQNNYWGSMNIDTVEMGIFHQPDDPTLGTVHYLPLFDPTVSLNDRYSSRQADLFSLHPNPANDHIIFSSSEPLTMIEIFDLSGEKLFSYGGINSEHFKINLTDFKPGIYFAKFTDRQGMSETLKFLKISK
jgi:parallel beta-helix repeat protein